MKVKFSKSVRFEPTFGGNLNLKPEERFAAELSVLTTGDLLNVMDAFQSSGIEGTVDTDKIDVTAMRALLKLVPELLPRYVAVSNFQSEDGKDITIKDIVESSVFLPLQVELLLQLSVISTPTDQSEKNLNAPPA